MSCIPWGCKESDMTERLNRAVFPPWYLLRPNSDGSDGKASVYNAGDPSSIPGLGRSPGEGNGNPLQYSSLENLMDRGAWWAMVHRVAESDTTKAMLAWAKITGPGL